MPFILSTTSNPGTATWTDFGPVGNANVVEVLTTLYNVQADDQVILVNQVPAAPVTVQLPEGATMDANLVWIKDKKGTAGAQNITVQPALGETIDGALSILINANYASRTLVFFNGEWSIV